MATVNIYDPGWIFFFIFFLVFNIFLLLHHMTHYNTTKNVVKFVKKQNLSDYRESSSSVRGIKDSGGLISGGKFKSGGGVNLEDMNPVI